MAKANKHKWTADEIIELLRDRYGKGGAERYVFAEQVAPSTGFSRRATWIDAMVFSLWPSDGLYRQAFEVKVARSDFLKEINTSEKNRWFKDHSHMFWYATAPGVVVSPDEVPEGCGWLLAQKGRLVVKKQASKRDVPNEISSEFFAAVARALANERSKVEVKAVREARQMPDIAHALVSTRALQAWFTSKGVIPHDKRYQNCAWETEEELIELLQRAVAGEGDAQLADMLDKRLRYFRDKVCEMMLEMTPYMADLLSDVNDIGRFISGRMGGQDFDLLADLTKKPGKYARYTSDREKKQRKAKLAYLRQLLDLASQADAEPRCNPSPKE